jgi:predicted O-linked N-acetylglucosamine transferase (SPINDLY family)
MDYRFSDHVSDPVYEDKQKEQQYVEELIRLETGFLCYSPSLEAGDISSHYPAFLIFL